MAERSVKPANLSLMMIPNGDIAVSCEALPPQDAIEIFGQGGDCPPQSLSFLAQEMTHTILTSPDPEDIDSLEQTADELRRALEIIEAGIIRLKSVF